MFCLYSIFSKVALIAIKESEIQLSLTDTHEEEPAWEGHRELFGLESAEE